MVDEHVEHEFDSTTADVEPDVPVVEAEVEAEPEPEYEPPSWIHTPYSRPQPEGRAAPPSPPPPPPRFEPPTFDADQLLASPVEHVTKLVRAYMDPIANALLQQQRENMSLRQNLSRVHEHNVRGLEREARRSVADAMREFSKDPAMANKTVRSYVEGFLQNRLQEGLRKAYEEMDPEMLQGLTSRNFLDVTFDYAKREAGYKEGRPPAATNPTGIPRKTGTGAPKAGSYPPLTPEEIEFCKIRGCTREQYAKLKHEHAEWSSIT